MWYAIFLISGWFCFFYASLLSLASRWPISYINDLFNHFIFSKPVEHDRLLECLPESKQPSSGSPANHDSGKIHYANNHFEQHNSETSGFKYLTLIPSRILCLLHDLAQQIVQAGHQQELLIIYG